MQVGEGIFTHIGFYGGTHNVTGVGHVVAGQAVNNAQDEIEGAYAQDSADGQGGEVGHTGVGQVAEDEGEDHLADCRQRGAE